ncbi:pilin [Carboxydothermus ferrireducens]|uniref:TrbL/VirB6 plasmid conjugal transfer protein n=1 Tax=Carboxydothermus ferrireducens DSM 11255 TaxID=1119529 RepID=A0ABX2R7J8_9THEO|nr:pilin [Carboxydothermus ferrireducens]NYE57137.1 hypothetical protein [Carboxydothermus ferrireducens DSM 11255]
MKKTKLIALLVLILLLALTATALASIPAGSGLGGEPNAQNGAVNSSSSDGGVLQLFTQNQWNTLMLWYASLSTITGGLLILSLVRMGYGQMYSGINPAVRAEFMEGVQRAFIAVAVMALTPVFVKLLLDINDAFVAFFADILNKFANGGMNVTIPKKLNAEGVFERILVAPFATLIEMIKLLFGLKPIDQLVFNGRLNFGDNSLFDMLWGNGIDTGNAFANAILQISLMGFTLYFNAVYTIRKWVIATNIAATPIIIWAWVISAERRIIEIWISEIIETIFKQTFHALTFGLYLSILAVKTLPSAVDGSWLASQFKDLAVWLAGFGGAIAVAFFIYLGFKLATAQNAEKAAEAKMGFQKVIIGLGVLGLILPIGSFLASTLSGNWGVGRVVIGGEGGGEITVWEVFFLLVTIIPVSKMLSSIFMSLVARAGTVDEERVAGIGLGALASAAGTIMMAGRFMGGLKGKGLSGWLAPGGKGNDLTPAGTVAGTAGGTTAGESNIEIKPIKGAAPGASATLYTTKEPSAIQRAQNTPLYQAAGMASEAGNELALKTGALGAATSFATPAVIPIAAGVSAGIGKAAGSVYSMAKQVGQGYKEAKQSGKGFGEFLTDYTGAKTKLGGATALATATAGSVLGQSVALRAQAGVLWAENKATQAAEKLENFIVRWR